PRFVAPHLAQSASSASRNRIGGGVMRLGYLLSALAGVALGATLTTAGATTLTMENVINRVPGSGEAGPNDPFGTFGLCQPSAINPATGMPNLVACAPGEIANYPAGVPR